MVKFRKTKSRVSGGVVELTLINIMAIAASGLMLIVTGGIIYFTASEWRDRRRQKRDKSGP